MSSGWTKDFDHLVWARALAQRGEDFERLTARASQSVQMIGSKASVDPITTATTPLFSAIAQPFVESLSQVSLFDRVLRSGQAVAMPYTAGSVVVSLTTIAGAAVSENVAKPVRSISFDAAVLSHEKAVCLVVASEEWLRGNGATEALTAELRRGLAQAQDAAFIEALAAGGDSIGSTGSTAILIAADIASAISTLGVHARSAFFMAVSPSTYAELALKMSTTGSLSFPDMRMGPTAEIQGIVVAPVESLETSPPSALVFDSSRLGIADGGLVIDSTRHANLEMSDTPSGSSASTSLWQKNLRGIRAERLFSLAFASSTASTLPAIQITNAW